MPDVKPDSEKFNPVLLELNPIFMERWSPRAFSFKEIPAERVRTLFEAARWSPSCHNEQPWLFLYAMTNSDLEIFRSILSEQNLVWAKRAPVLAFLFTRKKYLNTGKENRWAEFDAGAAWASLALQAQSMGLSAHAMAGFSEEKAYELLSVPREEYRAMAAIAIGTRGSSDLLPPELREREFPTGRVPINKMAREGILR